MNEITFRSTEGMGAVLHAGELLQIQASTCSLAHPVRNGCNRVRVPAAFAAKSAGQIRSDLWGFTRNCVDAALRFQASGMVEELLAMFPGMIEFHLPSGAAKPPEVLADELRLSQDLGLDSLALTEIAFKMDDLFGVPIEIREMGGVQTVGDFKALLIRKFDQA